ncbi:hypothetical protein H8356DRAFT_1636700 [Neocallimastix lanati (nom. inval.)]|uniref:Uncharacterized protein n=1 Tax=Neocallimastix californiae TaxID=1754190 RepID=A0A1Y2D8L9_9FUNG|nr:hypothetical protein H8356DRAFT_1636700 [Neocallimastix sp. JGI-2020a]ORY55567.1 hypothetical protein LY90DRAFT_507042 [Neocallimastix californiae]|eukprot:ORY55567.1 hypothetical protein LY90DRAFT_507042 [Neocallimastix californiae]
MKCSIILLLFIQIIYVLAKKEQTTTEKKEVLVINIEISGVDQVISSKREATMIKFTGTVDHPNFKGTVLTGGVDTQFQENDKKRTLSARYMIEGTDAEGQECKIFVENNGLSDTPTSMVSQTYPRIVTNCKSLEYLEEANLTGTLEMQGMMGVIIRIYDEGTPSKAKKGKNQKCWSIDLGFECCQRCKNN